MKYTSIRHFPAGVLNQNWGDVLSSFLFKKLAGFAPKKLPLGGPLTPSSEPTLLMAGSILHLVDSNSGVWGTGFISQNMNCAKPLEVHAVRGPLTRDLLLKKNMSCPEIYGDPALVLPKFYKPPVEKKFALGIIPHYVDQQHSWVQKAVKDPRVKFINILTGEGKILNFIDEVCSCEKVISSSLHGLICADAYGISSFWVEFSDKVIGKGFKFRDYFLSVGRSETKPIDFSSQMSVDDLISKFYNYNFSFDASKLLDACPIYNKSI